MATTAENKFSFKQGLNTDGGPFFSSDGFYKDAFNVEHRDNGSIRNRPGFELLNASKTLTINDLSDASYLFIPSIFYGEFSQADGTIVKAVILRYGRKVKIYQGELENIDIESPTQEITLSGVSDEAYYYRTSFVQEGNAVIMTNARSPIYKLVYGNSTGSETFSSFRVELAELNEAIYSVPRAASLEYAVPGFFMKEVPAKTSTIFYVVLEFLASAAPGYEVEVFRVGTDKKVTLIDPSDYVYVEVHDSVNNMVYTTITFETSVAPVSGESFRVYHGKTTLTDYDAELALEEITISDTGKDYSSDNSHSPKRVLQFGGRAWFGGVDGPLDDTLDSTYTAYGRKFRKIWISDIFPSSLIAEENTRLQCRPDKSPLDIDDNLRLSTEGGIIELDNSFRVHDLASYGTSAFVATSGGVWGLTGPEEYFSLQQVVTEKVLDHPISCKDPMVTTEMGLMVFGDNEVFLVNKNSESGPVINLVENRISSLYGVIEPKAKEQGFTRYDSYNRRGMFFYTDSNSGWLDQNKYKTSGLADKILSFDLKNNAWMGVWDLSQSVWGVFDSVVRPADGFIATTDYRYASVKKVNLVLLGRKNGNYTEITFGIMEGKKYCSDFWNTPYEAAFSSYVETLNSFGQELGVSTKKQVAKAIISCGRVEEDDADGDGYYEYPGALYMSRRWRFADSKYAGADYQTRLNVAQDDWDDYYRQIYWPHKTGVSTFGGIRPPHEAYQFHTKVRGRGSAIAFRFGNKYGDTTLTGSITEEEKPWVLYGYQLNLKGYRG